MTLALSFDRPSHTIFNSYVFNEPYFFPSQMRVGYSKVRKNLKRLDKQPLTSFIYVHAVNKIRIIDGFTH